MASPHSANGEPSGSEASDFAAAIVGDFWEDEGGDLFVDEGGFRDSIVDGVCGRLLPRDDPIAWHLAIEEAGDPEVAERWKVAGRARISELELDPQSQAEFIGHALFPNRSPLHVEEE